MFDKRIDVLKAIQEGKKFKDIFKSKSSSDQGFIYETIAILCIVMRFLIPNYEDISDIKLSTENMDFDPIKSFRELFIKNIRDGDNLSDISVKIPGKGWTPFSIKYKDTKGDSDLVKIDPCMKSYKKKTGEEYSLGYILKKKSKMTKHQDPGRPESVLINKVIRDNNLFDKKDVKKAFRKVRKILMKHASFMIGNSSAGIREAPSFKLPCINIGTRQQGRLRADNVIDVPHDVKNILDAIYKILNDSEYSKMLESIENPYGDGQSAKRIVDIIETVDLSKQLIQKLITY